MRPHCSLLVDAGYLLAAGSTRVTGTSLRSATDVDHQGLLRALVEQCEAASGLPLLRALWYDAGSRQGVPSQEQRALGLLPRTKLRLGRTGFNGEQKGVDVKLALDLTTMSRNRATEVVYLVSGDDDLSEAVEEAQQHGVQVIALTVPDADGRPIAVSQHLQLTVDEVLTVDGAAIDAHIRKSAAAITRQIAEATAAAAGAGAGVAEPGGTSAAAAESPEVPVPVPLPSPALMPNRPLVPAVPGAIILPTRVAVTAYTTETGHGGSFGAEVVHLDGAVEDAVEEVVATVVLNWWRSAPPSARAELSRARPMIPGDLDRALLNDLSTRLGIYDIPHEVRVRLRDEFWHAVDRL